MLEPAPQLDGPAFRLLRLITIDSYARGGETILNVDGGAIITGENGVGKTSLIRLIPVFFGELPRRISVGTQTFGDFYLARSTSYIVFEYVRRGVVCQVVLYAGEGDESFVYRFVRAPYDLRLFIEEDSKTIVPGAGLTTHLKKLGIDHSRSLPHDVYRAVIQGRAHAGREASVHRALVADYAFTTGANRLSHIDRIVSGMFKRQAEFRDFLRMVVGYISERDEAIAISGDRGRIAVWPRHYEVYQNVMRQAPRMEDVERLDAEMAAQQHSFRVLHAKTLVLIDHAIEQGQRLRALQGEAEARLEDETRKFNAADQELAHREATEGAKVNVHEERIAHLDEKAAEYARDDMKGKAALVDGIEEFEAKAKAAEARRRTLVGDKSEIDQKYTQFRNEAIRAHNARHTEALQHRTDVERQFQARLQELDTALAAALRTLAEEHRGTINAATEKVASARHELGGAEHAAQHPSANPEAIHRCDLKRTAAEKARAARGAPVKALDEARRVARDAKSAYDREDRAVQEIHRRIDDLRTRIGSLQAQSNPDPASLLAFLRREKPDWHKDVGRVVNEALLNRTDLDPGLVEPSAGMYGLAVDLSRLETALAADEARLQEEIRAAEAQQAVLHGERAAAEARLEKASAGIKTAEVDVREADRRLQDADAAIQASESEERTARHAMEQSRRDAKAAAEEEVLAARHKASAAREALDAARADQMQAENESKESHRARRDAIDAQRKEQLDRIDAEIEKDRQHTEAALKAYDAECAAALASKGVDVETLARVDDELAGVNARLAQARGAVRVVAEWRAWTRDEWSQREGLVAKAADARKACEKTVKRRGEKRQAWDDQRAAALPEIQRLETNAKASEDTAEAVRALIEKTLLSDHPADPETRGRTYDPAWTQDSLAAQTKEVSGQHSTTRSGLKKRIEEIKRAFRGGQQTPVEDYYHSTAAEVDPDDDNPFAWVAPLRAWYGGRHEEYLRPLLVEARKFGEMIIGFQRDVARFGREIAKFNRDMQEALNQTVVFRRITSVEISFTSTIAEKRYWQPINDFIRDHESWIHGIAHDLPPESFAADLERLLEHWDVREGIRAERLSLIDVSGKVTENGVEKRFRDSATLAALSSNGLSYLILIVIFVAFLRKIRGDADVCVTYAVDELGDLDRKNIGVLVEMLRKNGIVLVSACPDADVDVLLQFPNRYEVTRDGSGPELVAVDLDVWEPEHV